MRRAISFAQIRDMTKRGMCENVVSSSSCVHSSDAHVLRKSAGKVFAPRADGNERASQNYNI